MSNFKTKYALVGTGSRANMFIEPLVTKFRDDSELVALSDPNPSRLNFYNQNLIEKHEYNDVPTFHSNDFHKMILQTKPDVVIVTTIDAMHHKYIIEALELGCDVITEKPMTIDAEKCAEIIQAIEKSGRKLRVAFNYRWAPGATKVKELLLKNTIGKLIHVDMEYWLNTSHGADYFRRWHREKDKSGGLIVHKSTHHFDLVNWWTNSVPETVFGFGKLGFYGRSNAESRGEKIVYERYHGNETSNDPFALSLDSDERMKALYLDAEKHDGYFRDRNVFGDNISIEDSMSLLVQYRTGITLNYSLNAYLPREGFHIAFNGTEGRIEYEENHRSSIIGTTIEADQQSITTARHKLIVHPIFDPPYQVAIEEGIGGHGGGDQLLQERIFKHHENTDEFGRDAGHEQGAASMLVGSAANKSFKSGSPEHISKICKPFTRKTLLNELI
ncbi:MAG: Gfo/Idh/MocA family oxidoreductase [SAR202 cluster bacterium]|nr:Gfo/Idh/MocA family oxidoreductase [SAR202 cluster bacterium]